MLILTGIRPMVNNFHDRKIEKISFTFDSTECDEFFEPTIDLSNPEVGVQEIRYLLEEDKLNQLSNQINQPAETSIAYGQTKEQANAQMQERDKAWWEKVSREEFMDRTRLEPIQFKVRHPFIK